MSYCAVVLWGAASRESAEKHVAVNNVGQRGTADAGSPSRCRPGTSIEWHSVEVPAGPSSSSRSRYTNRSAWRRPRLPNHRSSRPAAGDGPIHSAPPSELTYTGEMGIADS